MERTTQNGICYNIVLTKQCIAYGVVRSWPLDSRILPPSLSTGDADGLRHAKHVYEKSHKSTADHTLVMCHRPNGLHNGYY